MTSHVDLIEDAKPQLCVNCNFYRELKGYEFGQCRIRAKTIEGFPSVERDEWCGEWKMVFPKKTNGPA